MHGLPSFIQCSPGGKGPQLKYHCTKEKQILLKHPACYTILIIDATVNYPIQWIKTIDRCLTLVHKKSRYFCNTQYTTLYWCYGQLPTTEEWKLKTDARLSLLQSLQCLPEGKEKNPLFCFHLTLPCVNSGSRCFRSESTRGPHFFYSDGRF